MHDLFSELPRSPARWALPLGAALACAALACATAPRLPAQAASEAPATAPAPPSPPPSAPQARREERRPAADVRRVGGPSPGVRTTARVTLAAVGDVLMHGAVKECAAAHRVPPGPDGRGGNDDGFGWLWEPVADLLSAADIAFANLETPIAPRSDRGSRSYVFNAPVTAARALARAGVDVVTVANNHVFDQGREGFLETLARLGEAGLAWVGAGDAGREAGPLLREVNGLRVAFLAYASFFNQDGNACPPAGAGRAPCVRAALLDPERAVDDVRRAAGSADAVVVSLHWGEEYRQEPKPGDVDLAHRLAEAGALVILGHHPHVLQPVELHPLQDGRVALIAYSLGNFISNQSRLYVAGVVPSRAAAPRDGAILRVELARRDYGRGVERVEIAGADYIPLWTDNDTAELGSRSSPRPRPTIRVVAIGRALAAVRAELAAFPDPVPAAQAPRWAKLRAREELLLGRKAAIAAVLGEDLESEPPPPPGPEALTSAPPRP